MRPNLVVTTGCPWRRGGVLRKEFTYGEQVLAAVVKEIRKRCYGGKVTSGAQRAAAVKSGMNKEAQRPILDAKKC